MTTPCWRAELHIQDHVFQLHENDDMFANVRGQQTYFSCLLDRTKAPARHHPHRIQLIRDDPDADCSIESD